MKYDVDYFIKKFEAIPEGEWCEYIQVNEKFQRCAYGWCMPKIERDDYGNFIMNGAQTNEGRSLARVLKNDSAVACINNGFDSRYQQPTPKQRILAALYDIKKMQQPEEQIGKVKVKTVYVSVPVSITEQAKELIQS